MSSFAQDAMQLIYKRKYLALKQRCEDIQQANEKLVNRIHNVKKILRRYKKERSVLAEKLDSHGDDYQSAIVPAFCQEEGAVGGNPPESLLPTGVIKQEPGLGLPSISAPWNPFLQRGDPANEGFMMFCALNKREKEEDHAQDESVGGVEISRLLAEEWHGLSHVQKQLYIDAAVQTKQEPTGDTEVMTSADLANHQVMVSGGSPSQGHGYDSQPIRMSLVGSHDDTVAMDTMDFSSMAVVIKPESEFF